MSDKHVVVLYETDGKYYLMINRDDASVVGFKNIKEGLDHFEMGYREAHSRSHEGSMSACIHFMFFKVSVVSMTHQEIEEMLGDPPYTSYRHGNVAGSMFGFETIQEKAKEAYENGSKPDLV